MNIKRLPYFAAATAVVGVGIGAMAGIANGSAATTSHHDEAHAASATATGSSQKRSPGPGLGGPPGPPGVIHSVSVVPNEAGTGFDTVTVDGGIVQSVSGEQLTITESTKTVTYKTVTLTIPEDATITLDSKTAKLSELQSEDHVTVSIDSDGKTTVTAFDSSYKPTGGPGPGGGPFGGAPKGNGEPPPQEGSSGG